MSDAIYFLEKRIAKDKALEMDWFKKHADTAAVLSGLLGAVVWMNAQFNQINEHIGKIEQRLVRIETVLIMQGIMPRDLAKAAP